jgi:outer membrane biosynthesis protein TonB
MANYERGSDDVRVFDGAEDEEDVEGSRLPLLIVIALLVLAAFGAVVWLAYQRGVAQGHTEVRTIAAEPGPAKVTPANPGGTQTPYTGLKIYQQRAPSDEEANVDTAPPPPSDALKPAPAPATPVTNNATPAPATPAPKPVVAAPLPVTPKPTPAPAAPKPAPVQQAMTAPPPPPKPTPAPVEATPAAAPPAGAGLLQIGAYKSEAEANTAWKTYKGKHSSLLSGLSPDVKQVDLGAKGTWYRLRIVAGSKDDASSLCTKLKGEGGDCLLAK